VGRYSNKYGDYDDAYPFAIDVVKNSKTELQGNMIIDKVDYIQDELLQIEGVESADFGTQYKLHLYSVKDNGWLNNLTEYQDEISFELNEIPVGKYIVDVWCKDYNSNKKYNGWKLKVIDIKQGPVGHKNLFINSECDMGYIKWTQEYNFLKNKNFSIDNDSDEEKFIVGMDSPDGTKVGF
jgi:hypothetical protein